jgi:hypothetical protein
MDLEGTGYENVEWIHLTQDEDTSRVRVSEEESFLPG